MSPYEQARELYLERGHPAGEFERDVELYARVGYVLATPLEFALVRPVHTSWSEEIICYAEQEYQLNRNKLTRYPNCWHLGIAIGELVPLLEWLPYKLPYISMERRNLFKIYKFDKIYEKSKNASTTNATASSTPKR